MDDDPIIVPAWLADEDAIGVCPCGRGIMGPMVLVIGETGLKYAYHPPCVQKYYLRSRDDGE